MSKTIWRMVESDGSSTITVLRGVDVYVIQDDHINFTAVQELLESDDDPDLDHIIHLMSVSENIRQVFEPLSPHISISNSKLYYDGDRMDNTLAREIIRFTRERDVRALEALVKFTDKVYTNADELSRESLFDWMNANGLLTILDNGNFIAYKGITEDFTSLHRGYGIVNNESTEGYLDNNVGNVIEFPRSQIDRNRSIHCSTGLHVGTFDYAQDYGSVVVACEVDPKDVVTVPNDYNGAKIRVCRYRVVQVIEQKSNDTLFEEYDD